MSEFIEVFSTDLQRIQPNSDIDFGFELESGTQPNFIPPYRMAPTNLRI